MSFFTIHHVMCDLNHKTTNTKCSNMLTEDKCSEVSALVLNSNTAVLRGNNFQQQYLGGFLGFQKPHKFFACSMSKSS